MLCLLIKNYSIAENKLSSIIVVKVENLVTVDSFYNAIIGKVVKIGAFI